MHSLKAFAKSTLGEIKDALVEAVGDDDDEEEDVPSSPVQTHPGINAERPVLKGNGGTDVAESLRNLSGNRESISANLPELAAVESPESEAARMEFQAVQGSPYLESILSQLDSEKAARAKEWNKGSLSIPEIAALSCWTLRQLFPLVPATQLTNQGQSETQRLLTSFSDRYEALLMEHTALQRKARELSHANTELARSAQQTESWKSAHGTAIARLEELSSENAELKERIRSSWANLNSDQDQSRDQFVRKLAQKDAEIRGLTEAMERLQEVVDDQSSLATKCWNLERELREAKEARETVDPMSIAIKPDDEAWRRETQTRQGSQESHGKCIAQRFRQESKRHVHQSCWQGADFLRGVCILEHKIFSFGKMTLRDRCSTSYDLASLFPGRRGTLDRWSGKIAKCIGTRPSALHSTFHV